MTVPLIDFLSGDDAPIRQKHTMLGREKLVHTFGCLKADHLLAGELHILGIYELNCARLGVVLGDHAAVVGVDALPAGRRQVLGVA